MVAFSLAGNTEALALKPGTLGSRGFLEQRHAAPARRTPICTPLLPTPCLGAPLISAVLLGLELKLSSPPAPHPRKSLPCQGKSPPSRTTPLPERSPAASTYLRPRGPREGPRLEPRSRPSSSRGNCALRAGQGSKMDSRHRPGPAPPPSSLPPSSPPAPRSASPAGFRLCCASWVSPFSRGREWVRCGGRPSGVCNRHRPRRAWKRGGPGAARFSLPERCARPRSVVPGAGVGRED
nr:PREDICTED: proline-rich receptor-like protein kinase PERK9 [Equus przewalskii]XP_008531691.1 PREDICTED: proline-rich receptor-like protein kinase PERK9 [Equus przewalskii]